MAEDPDKFGKDLYTGSVGIPTFSPGGRAGEELTKEIPIHKSKPPPKSDQPAAPTPFPGGRLPHNEHQHQGPIEKSIFRVLDMTMVPFQFFLDLINKTPQSLYITIFLAAAISGAVYGYNYTHDPWLAFTIADIPITSAHLFAIAGAALAPTALLLTGILLLVTLVYLVPILLIVLLAFLAIWYFWPNLLT